MIALTCDSCGKRSYLHVTKGNSELDFCRHHGIENSSALEADGWTLKWDIEGIGHLTPGIEVPV